MALPRPERPEYSTTIPSSGKKIRYQPFTVREEKILVLAAESKDPDEISNAVTNCIKNCVTSPVDLNINELALFDIEYLFLKTRAKSVGEKIELTLTDPDDVTFSTNVSINVDKINVTRDKNHTDIIDIGGDIQVKMNYPDINFFTRGLDLGSVESGVEIISTCLSSIIHGDEVYVRGDMSVSEVDDWVSSLSTDQFNKIMNFFFTMPKLSHTLKTKNTNTGKEFSITLEGLSDFF